MNAISTINDLGTGACATHFCFFSAGFKIWNEHSRDSSTLIMAPALSNSPQ